MMKNNRRRTTVASTLLALSVVVLLAFGVGTGSALGNGYTNVVFSDGFESGGLTNWNGLLGNGAATVTAASAHTGTNGLGMSNASGQFQVLVKALPSPLMDTSVKFSVRVAAGAGLETVAMTRDDSTALHMWDLMYDGNRQGFILFPYSGTGATEIFTGVNSAPAGAWNNVEVQYTASATGGGAQLYINGQTQAGWGVTGDYTRTANLQRLQLWNDGPNAVDFDDVSIAVPSGAPSVPGAPTGVAGVGGQRLRRSELDRACLERRRRDLELPDHAVRRRDRADADQHGLGLDLPHGHRPDERHGLHLHGRCDERGRHRS